MAQKFSNKARSQLLAAITATDTSFSVVAAEADLFPTADVGTGTLPSATGDWFKAVLENGSDYEIVYVRTRSAGSNVFSNVLRGQEGTTPKNFPAGSIVGVRVTAQDAETAAKVPDLQAQITGLASSKLDVAATSFGGNAGTATKLQTARTISLTGGVSGSASFDGSGDVSITATVANNSHSHSNYADKIVNSDKITGRIDSGFYETSTAAIEDGWPQDINDWYHLISSTHSNVTNYYAMQFAGDFRDSNQVYYRATNGSGTTAWNRLLHSGNYNDYAAAKAHTHATSDVTGLQTALDGKISSTEKGAANGVAPLGADSKIPATYLPSYVDDVLEYANQAAFPSTGATGIIYVALDTNRVYRWSGSAYVEISPSPGSTDAVPEGTTNLYFTDARARAAAVQDTISDAVTDRAPSQNAVFDALAGKANTNHTHAIANVTGLQAALDGKLGTTATAAAATKLATARTLTIGNTGKSFDGSANVSWSLDEIGVTAFGLGGHSPLSTASPDNYPLGSFISSSQITESESVSLGFPSLGGVTDPRWWNVITFGHFGRRTQIATEVFGVGTIKGRTFVRIKHDETWHPWQEIYHSGNLGTATESRAGIVELATTAEAQAGTDDTKMMTPLKTAQAIAKQTSIYGPVGLVQVQTGGGAGFYQRVDDNFNPLLVGRSAFHAHPIYHGIVEQTIDGQLMVKIPKFYFKAGTVPSGTYAGKAYWMISDQPAPGFSVHPAFIGSDGVELDQIWVGKYQASASDGKLQSVPGVLPRTNMSFPTARAEAYARNTGGVSGFRLWSYYDLAAIQMLATIEMGGLDMQALIGQGRVSASSAANVDASDVAQATWRGIVGLWGNVWQMVDGLKNNDGNWWRWQYNAPGNTTTSDFATGYVNTGRSAPTTAGYPVTFDTTLLSAGIIVPATVDGTRSNGSTGDYYIPVLSTGDRIIYYGGDWNHGADAGLFYLHPAFAPFAAHVSVGSRLAKV